MTAALVGAFIGAVVALTGAFIYVVHLIGKEWK